MKLEPMQFLIGETDNPGKVQRLLANQIELDTTETQDFLHSALGYSVDDAEKLLAS